MGVKRTLLFSLIFLLIGGKQHVIWQAPPRYSSLSTHTVTFTRQASSTESSVGKCYTTLLFHIYWPLRLWDLRFRGRFLLFRLLFLQFLVRLGICFAFLRVRLLAIFHSVFTSRFLGWFRSGIAIDRIVITILAALDHSHGVFHLNITVFI